MFFPISDDDQSLSRPAYVTMVLLALNIALFFVQLSSPAFTYGYSVVPWEISTGQDLVDPVFISRGQSSIEIPQSPGPVPIWLTLFSAMFMHGGFAHIMGNMLYLWIFGDNVEHRFGATRFLVFYLAAGLVATGAQILMDPRGTLPILGASGAIAGIMGAYMVLFPYNRVNAVFFYQIVSVPAVLVLGMWIVTQLFSSYGSLFQAQSGGVAYMAHVGGFFTGVVAGLIARSRMGAEPDSLLRRNYQRDPRAHRLW